MAKIRVVLKPREKIKRVVVTLLLEVTDHVEGDLFYFEDGGGGGMGGGCFGSKEISHSIKSKICTSILGVRVPRI